MDLRQLEYLVAVADHGSFTAAARALHVSQPTLSHGVRTLEAEVGVELFARLGRSVAITAAGSEVIDAARRVVRDMADVTAAAASVAALETGTVELAALPTLAVDPLAGILGRFRQRHPAVSVRVLEPEDAATVEHAVRSGRAELGLTDIGVGGRGLVRQALGRQEIVLVAPPQWDHLPDTVTAKELVALALVATPVGTSTRRLLDLTVARSGREPTIAVEVHHREAIAPLVLAGAGAALLPKGLAAEAARRGAIVRELRPRLARKVGVVHREGRLSPAAEALLALAVAR